MYVLINFLGDCSGSGFEGCRGAACRSKDNIYFQSPNSLLPYDVLAGYTRQASNASNLQPLLKQRHAHGADPLAFTKETEPLMRRGLYMHAGRRNL